MENHNNGNSASFVKIPEIKFTKLFINGEFVDSISGKTFETIDPRTGESIARISEGDKEDIDLAVKAARLAFDNGPWPRMSGAGNNPFLVRHVEEINQLQIALDKKFEGTPFCHVNYNVDHK